MSDEEIHGKALLTDAPLLNAQYRVIALLGEGGMGRVYRAEHRLTGQVVAIKALRSELSSDPVFRSRFLLEAQVLSRLDHPSITHLLNFIEESDGRLFLIMQYVAGKTLEALIMQVGPLPAAVAMTVMHEILDAFDYAHAQGIIHRDIKPANIVLPPTGGVKVMDFGIARMESGVKLTSTGASLGSPAYMAPEQVTGSPVDARCDIYALGVMLFEMMTGDIPFPGDSGYVVMKAHVELPAPDPRDIVDMPDRIADAILAAMRKNPEERPRRALDLAAMLPTAEELGGSDAASWSYVVQDHRSAVEVSDTGTAPTLVGRRGSRPRGRQAPPSAPTTATWGSDAAARQVSGEVAVYGPGDPPRSSPVAALLATGVLMILGLVGLTHWMGTGSQATKPEEAPAVVLPDLSQRPVLVIKGQEMVPVPGTGRGGGFYLDRTEVTYRMYRSFLEACPIGSPCGPREPLSTLQLPDAELEQVIDHPATHVTWNDAGAFCRWAGKRLPTSDEWTRAATGDDRRRFPWGSDAASSAAWIAVPTRRGAGDFYNELKSMPGQLATIGVHDPRYYLDEGPFGVMGLGGDVSEWVSDEDPVDANLRLVAGGSWATYDVEQEAKGTDRIGKNRDSSSASIGFRCALDSETALRVGRPAALDRIKKAGRVRIGAEQESPPMFWKNEQGQDQGFEFELMNFVARTLGVELTITPIIYPDLPARLRASSIDLIIAAYTPDSSIRGVEWSIPYLEYGLAMVVKKDSPFKTIKDLDGKVVGHYNDPATARAVAQLVPRARRQVKYENRYLEDLASGQIDAFFYDFPFLQAELLAFRDSLRIAQFGLTEATYNVGIAEGEWSLVREVNRAITAWEESGEYPELVKKYLGGAPPVTDIPPGSRTTLVLEGDTLRSVAARELGDENRWTEIWELNRSRLGNRNLLYVGTPLLLPAR